MTNAYDANGWEREPFGGDGNIRNPEYEFDGPANWQKPVPVVQPPHGGPTLHRKSPSVAGGVAGPVSVLPVRVRPAGCSECRAGKGVVVPGPPHCAVHDRHCSAEECW